MGEFPSAGFERGAQGTRSAAKGKSQGCISFAYFSLGKQRKVGWVRGTPRFQKQLGVSANNARWRNL